MKKISRRSFLVAGAAAAVTGSALALSRSESEAYEYTPPTQLPFSPKREEINRIIAGNTGKPRVVKVGDRLYYGLNYALANMVMVETDEGLVIIDTTESLPAAKSIMAEFRKISNKPVKVVIYTHNHRDHFLGTKACYQDGLKVIAHDDFMKEVKLQESRGQSAATRSAAMFGLLFPVAERFPWLGTFPSISIERLMLEPVKKEDLIWPTETFQKRHSFKLGGLTFNLIHAPGETPDQFIVEVPELKFVYCADNYYPSFPNLYTIRGTADRPVQGWAACQDIMIKLAPELLIPGHGTHIEGKDQIKEVLTNYREAILYVYNLAHTAVKEFKPINEVAAAAALPPHLAELPYLQQHYGFLPYSVRSIYGSLVGWFDGDPVNLNPLSKKNLGQEILELAGSADNVLAQAEKAQKAGRHQAVLELCEMVLANDRENRPARLMKISSMMALSNLSTNKPTINYYKGFAAMERSKMERSKIETNSFRYPGRD
jgi:alkyl sulfatase BDS1-like metallo-beta-lactamase superfamily hydrolase